MRVKAVPTMGQCDVVAITKLKKRNSTETKLEAAAADVNSLVMMTRNFFKEEGHAGETTIEFAG